MKTIFKVFGLEEKNITTFSWLTINGIESEKESVTLRLHQGDFDTELDALKFVENGGHFEHGFEIVKVFVPK